MALYTYSKESLERIKKFNEKDPNFVSLAKLSYHAALRALVQKQIEEFQSYKNPVLLSIALEKKAITSIEERVAFLDEKIAIGKEIIAETKVAEKFEKEQFSKYCETHPEVAEKAAKKFARKAKVETEKTLA